jgi:hypothetical protein
MKITVPFWRTALVLGSMVGAFAVGFCMRPLPAPPASVAPAASSPTAYTLKPQAKPPSVAASWNQLESSDYRTFVTNLRRFGCPKSTVADIVMSDLLAAGRLDVEWRNQFWSHLASSLPDRTHAENVVRAANQLLPDLHLSLSEQHKGPSTDIVPTIADTTSATDSPSQTAARAFLESAIQQGMMPNNLAASRVMRHYRGLQLSSDEASALVQLEQSSSPSESNPETAGALGADSSSNPKDAIRRLLGEDRYQEYERMQDRSYVKLQDVLEDLKLDANQIVATYESLKATQTLGDPAATAAELSQRFGADAAESWIESVNPSRPGYEGEIAAIASATSPDAQTAEATPPLEPTVPGSPARP